MVQWLLIASVACRPDPPVGTDGPPPTPTPTADTATTWTGSTALPFTRRPPPNLLMISVDTLRKDWVGRYGTEPRMPFLTDLMGRSFTLDDHLTCSNWTFPGTTCTLLGALHEDRDHMPKISLDGRAPFPDGTPFLASQLQQAGFETALVTGNGWLSAEWNTAQGYGDGSTLSIGGNASDLLGLAQTYALAWQAGGAERWFVHVHVMEPHAPYNPPESYLDGLDGLPPVPFDLTTNEGHYTAAEAYATLTPDDQANLDAHLQVRYAGELAYLDDNLETGLGRWEETGLLDDTLVVLWTDHGEARWEHGHVTHAWDLYAQENDGILLFHHADLTPTAYTAPTHATDLAPTLLDLYDLEIGAEVSGHVIGTAPVDRDRFALTIARAGGQSSVVRGPHKLLFHWRTGQVELFDRVADPTDAVDLYGPDHPAVVDLWPVLKPHVERAAAQAPEEALVWPPELP